MRHFAVLLSVVLSGTPAVAGAPPVDRGSSATVPRCLVSLLEEAQVPAQEAGVLREVNAREGQQVSTGEQLGQIDTAQAEIAKEVAELQLEEAHEKATNDVNIRYAQEAAKYAKAEYDSAVWLNDQQRGTVPLVELNRLNLAWTKAKLQIEQSQQDQKIFGIEERIRQAEHSAAEDQVSRRQVCSPMDGVVVKVYRHAGEWLKPGDPAFHVVRMDRLRIEGFVNESRYAPSEIDGRPVSVEITLSHGRQERFTGRIVFVSPLVQAGGDYRVWAEVDNRQEGQHWLLRSGQLADMTIHLDGSQPMQSDGSRP